MELKHAVFSALVAALTSAAMLYLITPSKVIQTNSDQSSKMIERVAQLEKELAEERQARLIWKDRPINNSQVVDTNPAPSLANQSIQTEDAEQSSSEPQSRAERIQAFRERQLNRQQEAFRKKALINSGFNEQEATWVLENEAQVQLDALNEQYRARRRQYEVNSENGTQSKARNQQLRERLGEDYYERYLEANGYSTSVGIASVIENSPGQNAGLQAGDQITRYDGKRVYSIRELNGLTVLGEEGANVLVEVERDGEPVQLNIPRGPIGITGLRGGF